MGAGLNPTLNKPKAPRKRKPSAKVAKAEVQLDAIEKDKKKRKPRAKKTAAAATTDVVGRNEVSGSISEPAAAAVATIGHNNPPVSDAEEFDGMAAPSVGELSVIEQSVRRAVEIEDNIRSLDEAMKGLQQEYQQMIVKIIPDAMAAARTEEFKTSEGLKVSIKEFLNGTLPKEPSKRKDAMTFVIGHGGEGLIKRKITIELGKGEYKTADRVVEGLKKAGIEYSDKEDVHPQTYCSFMRELMKAGENVPLDDLGLFAGRAAKIVRPKQKAF